MVFRVSIALVALLVLVAGLAPGPFNALMQATMTQVVRGTGWLYLLVVFLALLFMLY
ncbi:MAG: BCCT family transporter, partial [Proteobacteria bacterium]|nr:BCCT family transporter [Pseudomonadota bacterium]